MFSGCTSLGSVSFPLAKSIGNGSFNNCRALTSVVFPAVTTIDTSAFSTCVKLTTADFYVATKINASVFKSCATLQTLILRSETLCTLANVSAFTGTKIAGGTGYVYVPSALVDAYRAATNWSTYADQIRAIEDYPEITGGVA